MPPLDRERDIEEFRDDHLVEWSEENQEIEGRKPDLAEIEEDPEEI